MSLSSAPPPASANGVDEPPPHLGSGFPLVDLIGWVLIFVLLALPGIALAYRGASPLGFAAGFAIALLTLEGFLLWPVIAIGAFAAYLVLAGSSPPDALLIACADTLEAVAAAAVLRRFGLAGEVGSVRQALVLIGAALFAPMLSATVLGLGFALFHSGNLDHHGEVWVIRWMADASGILLSAPWLLAWAGENAASDLARRPYEFAAILLGTLALVGFCYWYDDALSWLGLATLPPAAFLLPPVVWAVVRLRPRDCLTVLVLASSLAIVGTVLLSPGNMLVPLLRLQLLVSGIAIGCLLFIGATMERIKAQQSLKAKEEGFRIVFDQAAVGMALTAADGRLISVNRSLCETFGYAPHELIGRRLADMGDPTFLDSPWGELALVAEREERSVAEKRYRRKDGTPLWVRISSSRLEGAGDACCLSMVEDISVSHRAEAALRQSEERLRYVTEAAEVGYWDWDLSTNRLEWSERCKILFGISAEESLTYERFLSTINPDDRERTETAVQKALRGDGDYDVELRVVWPCGTDRWIHSKGRVAFDAEGKALRMAGVAMDITSRKAMEDAVRRLSQHDALTGLPNRVLIHEYASHLLAQARRDRERVAFLFVDLDRFKPINDSYGHDVGDTVLKEVARRLAGCVRGEDFVGRLGGDEFLVVLTHIHRGDNAAKVALHALVRLDMPMHVESLSLQVTPSIGISVFPDDGATVDELIKNADTAMYHAKECGRNNFQFFRPELNIKAERALNIEGRLREALDRGEFQLYFQPVVDLANGRPWAAEALLRWPGMDAEPGTFIAVAEAAGLMQPLGRWVLREACRQQRRWLDKGLPLLPVAVNISAAQLRDKAFAQQVADAVQEAGLSAPGLRLELTESTVMGQAESAAATLPALHDMGVKVAVDNFGVGLSSMDRLSHLPLDILKLDKTFVRAIGRDPKSVAVIEAILALARSLALEVVAEGVETEDELAFLRQHRCALGQGYLFSRPLPARQFENWYREALAA